MDESFTKTIFWEWENDFGWWIPYEPPVGAYLEKKFSAIRLLKPLIKDPVPLADAQESLSRYEIEFSFSDDAAACAGFQRNSTTGNERRVRRRLVPGAKRVLWRWQGDGPDHIWHPYAYDISRKLESIKNECEAEQALAEMDLQTCFVNYPYTVDVIKRTQRRNSTGFTRRIRRDENVGFPQLRDDSDMDTFGGDDDDDDDDADGKENRIIAVALSADVRRCTECATTGDVSSNVDHLSVSDEDAKDVEGASCAIFVEGAPLHVEDDDDDDDDDEEEGEEMNTRESAERAASTAGPSVAVTPLSKTSFSVDENLTEELTSPTTPSSPPAASTSFSSCTGSFFKKFRARAKMSMTPISSTSTSVDGSQPSALSAAAAAAGGGADGADGNGITSLQCFQADVNSTKIASSVSLNPVSSSAQSESPPGASHSPVIASKSAPDSFKPSLGHVPPISPSEADRKASAAPASSNANDQMGEDAAVSEEPSSSSRQHPGRRRKKKSRLYFATFTKAINFVPRTNSAVIDMTNMLLIPLSFQMVVTPAPIFYPPSTDPCYLLSVPGIPDPSRKAQKKFFKKKLQHISVDDVLTKHTADVPWASVKENFKEAECGICMETLTMPSSFSDDEVEDSAVSRLNKCKHAFHRACLVAMYQSGSLDASLQCPSCKAIHGEKKGVCPPGFMDYYLNPKHSVPGFDDSEGTIVIVYYIKDGVQGPEHPNPEMPYFASGFPRQCYLPNNAKGRMILQLLIVAWERRLTFTIGVSATTGADNTVTWNEIHHKTEWGSNRTGHGYPDPNYLDNVMTEMAIQGVTTDDILPPSTPLESISINESDPAVRPKGKKSRV